MGPLGSGLSSSSILHTCMNKQKISTCVHVHIEALEFYQTNHGVESIVHAFFVKEHCAFSILYEKLIVLLCIATTILHDGTKSTVYLTDGIHQSCRNNTVCSSVQSMNNLCKHCSILQLPLSTS